MKKLICALSLLCLVACSDDERSKLDYFGKYSFEMETPQKIWGNIHIENDGTIYIRADVVTDDGALIEPHAYVSKYRVNGNQLTVERYGEDITGVPADWTDVDLRDRIPLEYTLSDGMIWSNPNHLNMWIIGHRYE